MRARRGGARATGLALAALILATALAACTAEVPPVTRPAATTTDSPTPAPSPTRSQPWGGLAVAVPPVPPAALDGPGNTENAKAVAEYFVELYGYVFATNDLTAWNALSAPDCLFCQSVRDDVNAAIEAGHHNEGGRQVIEGSVAVMVEPGVWFDTGVTVGREPTRIVDEAGTVIKERGRVSPSELRVGLRWEGGAWHVDEAASGL